IKHITKKSLTLSNQAFLNKWRSGRDCYTEHQRAPGVTGRLALKQKANQLNYRSTSLYLLFLKYITKKSLTLSNQAFPK
ncbi:hypothetical protein, partial [Photobacterium damselae]|uniref:hypothetical protein n=1 Tax=Photobacterium damselae TaxID=38293 RepID=UPI00406790C1